MIKKFCDICGKEIHRKYTSDLFIRMDNGAAWESEQVKEICQSCFYKIRDFLDKMRKEAKKGS